MGRMSSTHILHVNRVLAILPIKWAASFPLLRTWEVVHAIKQLRLCKEPSTTFWIGHDKTQNYAWTSPSIMISLKPNSHANWTPSCTAYASASKAYGGSSIHLLMAPIISPSSFLIATPTLQLPDSLKTAPSTFILYQPHLGGDQWDLGGFEGLHKLWVSYLNSLTYFATSFMIRPASLRSPPCVSVFLWFQRLQAVTAKVSQSIPSFASLISHTNVRLMVKWLNSPFPNSLSFWDNR